MMSQLEDELGRRLNMLAAEIPTPEREYRFHPIRRWRFDFAWPERMLACEVEGGTWMEGRHTRGAGFEADCQKYNEAALLGWRVLRFTGRMVETGEALDYIARALSNGSPATIPGWY